MAWGIVSATPKINAEARKIEFFDVNHLPRSLPYWQREYVSDAAGGVVHESEVVQGLKFRSLLNVLSINPEVFFKPFSLVRKLTQSS